MVEQRDKVDAIEWNDEREGRDVRIAGDVNPMVATKDNEEIVCFSHDGSISALRIFRKLQVNEIKYFNNKQLVMDHLRKRHGST